MPYAVSIIVSPDSLLEPRWWAAIGEGNLYKIPCLMLSWERVFPVENQFRWLWCGDVGTWAVVRGSQAENGFECGFKQLLFHFWLDRNLPEKVFPFVTQLVFLHFKESCITFSSPPWGYERNSWKLSSFTLLASKASGKHMRRLSVICCFL